MEVVGGGNVQKVTPLARELSRIFNSYNKHSIQLKKNLKETNAFFREIKRNYSNACASAASSEAAALEAGKNVNLFTFVTYNYRFSRHHHNRMLSETSTFLRKRHAYPNMHI